MFQRFVCKFTVAKPILSNHFLSGAQVLLDFVIKLIDGMKC